mgnify:CR=1 FL=1
MEALTAASVAALTVYDMAKAIDKAMDDRRDAARREDEVVKAAVLTVSDGVRRGDAEDESGDTLDAAARVRTGYEVERRVVPDDATRSPRRSRSSPTTRSVVLTTGGTGLGAARRHA